MLRHALLGLQLASAFVSDLIEASKLVGMDFSLGLFFSIGVKVSRPLFRRDINTGSGNETSISTQIEKPTDRKDIKTGRDLASMISIECLVSLYKDSLVISQLNCSHSNSIRHSLTIGDFLPCEIM